LDEIGGGASLRRAGDHLIKVSTFCHLSILLVASESPVRRAGSYLTDQV
jgi:hypothetical protein